MKTIVSEVIEEKLIDWSKVQLVVTDDGRIVLTTGEHDEYCFSGTCVHQEEFAVGRYLTTWNKNRFKIFTGKLTLEN